MEKQTTTVIKSKGGSFRWITISTLLLSIGVILRMVSPSIAGVTPNWLIAMYSLAILLCKPTLRQAFGVGLVAAIVATLTSKAAFPYANLLSEPLGAVTCAIVARYSEKLVIKNITFQPIFTVVFGTIISGLAFITSTKLALNIPMEVYLYAMVPFVGTVAVVNTILTSVLYIPSRRLFEATGLDTAIVGGR